MMDFKRIDDFLESQRRKHNDFIGMYLTPLAYKYNIQWAAEGLVGKQGIPDVSKTDTIAFSNGIPCKPIRELLRNTFSFKSKNGEIYWAAMPETALSVKDVEQQFINNGVRVLEVTDNTPCGNVLIMFDCNALMNAYPQKTANHTA